MDSKRDLGAHVGAVDDHSVTGPVRPVRRVGVGRIRAPTGRVPFDVVQVRRRAGCPSDRLSACDWIEGLLDVSNPAGRAVRIGSIEAKKAHDRSSQEAGASEIESFHG